jgi:hypothetical protein
MLEIIGVDDLFSYPSPKEIKGELVDSSLIEVLNSIVIESEREGCRDGQIRSQNQTGLGRIDGHGGPGPNLIGQGNRRSI